MKNNKENNNAKTQINKLVAVAAATAVSLGTVVNMESAAFAATDTTNPDANMVGSGLLGTTITPVAPTGLTVAAGDGTITANWVSSTDGTDSYKVTYSTSSTFAAASTVNVVSTDNTEIITGLKPLTTYYVKVAGISAGVVGTYSTVVTAKTFGAPAAPTSLKLTVGVKSLSGSWVAPTVVNGSPVTGYSVQYSADSTFATGVTTVDTVSPAYVIPGLADGGKYYVRVAAKNALGQSAYTAAVSATTAVAPLAAQTVTATAAAGSSTVAWKAPTSTGGVALTGYRVEYSKDANFATVAGSMNVAGTVLTAVVKPLDANTAYYYRVIAINGVGEAPASNVASATSFPVASAPATASATAGVASAVIKWTAPASNGGSPVTGYKVEYSTSADFSGSKTVNAASTAVSATLTGLTAGATYYVRVAATTLAGTGAYASTTVKVFSAPASPASVNVLGGAANFKATWVAPADNGGTAITGYRLEYSTDSTFATGVKTVSVASTVLTSTVTALPASTTYYVRVVALNAAGASVASTPLSVSTVAAPDAPVLSSVKSSATTTGPNLVATWTATPNLYGQVLTNYSLQYSTDSTFATGVKTVLTKSLTTTIASLPSSTKYYVRVAALSAAGTGAYSAPLSVTTVASAAIPVNVTASVSTAKSVTINVPVVAGVTKTTVQASLASTFTSPITVTAVNGKATFTGLAEGTVYSFRAQDTNSVGASGYSATVTASTLAAPVTNVATSNVGVGSATLTWTASASTVTGYNVYKDGILLGSVASGVTSFDVSGLNEGTSYVLSVAAVNASGESAKVDTSVKTSISAPGPVTNLAASAVNPDSVTLSWSGSTAGGTVASYNIYEDGIIVGSAPAGATSFTVSALSENTSYVFSVEAVNVSGVSAKVNVSAKTGISLPSAVVNVVATNVSTNSASISWSGGLGGGGVVSYNIYKDGVLVGNVGYGLTSYNVTGLAEDTSYVLSVEAVNSTGVSGVQSVTVKTLFSAPSVVNGLAASNVTSSGASLSWNAASGKVDGYKIYKDGVLAGITANTSYDLNNLSDGTVYNIDVVAYNSTGDSIPVRVSFTTVDVVSAVTNLAGVNKFDVNGDQYAHITWTANPEAATYNVYKNGVLLGSSGLYVTSYDAPLNIAEEATFSVVAVKADGVTKSVAADVIVKAAAVYAVNNVHVNSVGQHTANVAWDAQARALSYDVYANGAKVGNTVSASYKFTTLNSDAVNNVSVVAVYSDGNSKASSFAVKTLGNVAPVVNVSNVVPDAASLEWDSVAGVESYQVVNGSGVVVSEINVSGQTAHHITYDVKNLQANTSYTYSVKAVMIDGVSSVSVPVKTSALTDISLHVASNSYTSADIAWTQAPGASGYRVSGWGLDVTLPANATSYTVTGLTPGGMMTSYTVTPIYSFGDGITGTVYLTGMRLPNPENWAGVANSTTSATLSWSEPAVSGATLQAHDLFLDGMYVATVPAGTTSYTFTGLKANTSYFMSVNSVYNVGSSFQSGVSVKTPLYDAWPVASVDTYAISATSVNVGWKRIFNDPNLVSYTIKMNGVKLIDIDPTSSFYVVNGLTGGTTYNFTVTANYTFGSSTPVASSVTTLPAPIPAPAASYDATVITSNSIQMVWKNWRDPDVVSFTLTKNGVKVIDIDPTSSFFVFNGLASNTSYTFGIKVNYTYGTSTEVFTTAKTL